MTDASRSRRGRLLRAFRRVPRALAATLLGSLLLATGGCLYTFSGGGLPDHVKTVAVLPFENETAAPDLPRELQVALRDGLRSRLGLRDASEENADALVRGKITRFVVDDPVSFSSNPNQATSARRRLSVQVDIEIVDQVTGRVLWARTSMQAQGEYAEGDEAAGREQAVDRLVADVIEGAQSQW